jgi:Zn-dependent protease with chaperone function
MQVAILTAVLAAIASAESGGGPVAGVVWRLLLIGSATLIAPLAALVGTQRLAATLGADDDSEQAISRLQTLIVGLWLSAVALILLVAEWPRIVRDNWRLAGWPLLDELAILLPVIASLLLVWAALYRLERATQLAVCKAQQMVPPPARLMHHLWLMARHHLGLMLLPPLLIVGFFESLAACGVVAARVDAAWWLVVPLVGSMLVLMPLAVRRIWCTTPLAAGPLREILEQVCFQRRCGVREILIWHTDFTMGNAAVVGLSRWLRYMLLTDVVVSRLSDDEIAAVVRHELAHLRRWHLPLRLAMLLLPVAWWLAIRHAWPEVAAVAKLILATVGVRPELAAAFAVPLGLLAYTLIVVGWYSRLLEHDADLDACLNDDGQLDPSAGSDFCSALTTLCGRSRESRISQWSHPSIAARVEFLGRVIAKPSFAAAFRRRASWIAAGMAILYLAAAIIAAC